MSIKGITPGRAYRAYRFPTRAGGRLSRRVSAVRPVGTLAGVLTASMLSGLACVGVGAAATFGYFASGFPPARALATVPLPLTTHIHARSGDLLRRHGPEPADAREDGPPPRPSAGALRLRPDPGPGGREGAPVAGAQRDGRERLRDARRSGRGQERGERRQARDDLALRAVV